MNLGHFLWVFFFHVNKQWCSHVPVAWMLKWSSPDCIFVNKLCLKLNKNVLKKILYSSKDDHDQIPFSFSSDKDRRTDSLVGAEREENLIRNDPNKSEFMNDQDRFIPRCTHCNIFWDLQCMLTVKHYDGSCSCVRKKVQSNCKLSLQKDARRQIASFLSERVWFRPTPPPSVEISQFGWKRSITTISMLRLSLRDHTWVPWCVGCVSVKEINAMESGEFVEKKSRIFVFAFRVCAHPCHSIFLAFFFSLFVLLVKPETRV